MAQRRVVVPEAVAHMQIAANGEAGRAWLADLPRLIDQLCDMWRIEEIGPAFSGGCVSYVAPVVIEGTHAVLKASLLDEETECEADALALWDGCGAVRLLKFDEERGAMLLERLEPGTSLAEHPERGVAINIACGLLRRLWKPAPVAHGFRLVSDVARRYKDELPAEYERAGGPFGERLLRCAVELCQRLAEVDTPVVMANRDFHLGNILAARREPWLAIDPKPLVGEPAFDAAHLIRSLLPEEIVPAELERLVAVLAERLDLATQRIAEWVFVRSIENALWGLSTGAGDSRWDVAWAQATGNSFHLL